MPTELSPSWMPIRCPIAVGETLFDPVFLHGRGLLIAGGADGLVLFSVGKIKGVFATIPKRSWINGFAVHGTVLYVQDGPVLLAFELTYGKPIAAINLVTDAHWPESEGDDISEGVPNEIFALAAPQAALQETLYAARRHHEALHARDGEPAAPLLAASQDSLGAALKAAERIVFSAPVIRERQVDSRRYGQVFTMRLDGKIHAMDDELTEAQTFAGPAALRAELLMVELPQQSGEVRCNLYYVGATGNIVAIDATTGMTPLRDWPAKGPVTPAKVLPLRCVDGMLMGGGILGHDFFMLRLDPAMPPVLTQAGPATGWTQCDVAPAEKLVLLSNGLESRLLSYHPSAATRDRWRLRREQTRAWSLFWPDTGSDAVLPGPKLALEVTHGDPETGVLPEARVVFANTIDSPNDDGRRTTYPQPSTTLATSPVTPGAFEGRMQPLGSFACRPVITQQTMFCIYRVKPNVGAVGTFHLAAFMLNGLLGEVLPAANAKLEETKGLVRPVRIRVTRLVNVYPTRGTRTRFEQFTAGPYVQKKLRVSMWFREGEGTSFDVTTDDDGIAVLSPTYDGRYLRPNLEKLGIFGNKGYCLGGEGRTDRILEMEIVEYVERDYQYEWEYEQREKGGQYDKQV